jgi:tripartite-type tricarboxylate transporter receptor subunit TctC
MSEVLGKRVVIEPVPGAGGTIAPTRLSRSAPDGYTIMIHHVALLIAPAMVKALSYDTETAFDPVGMVTSGPYVVATKPSFEANTSQEFISKLRTDGSKINVGHSGIGSSSYLCGLIIAQTLGIKPAMISYRGTGPALTDLIAGQIDVMCDQTTNLFPQIEAKSIKGFAISTQDRHPGFPSIPTFREIGLGQAALTVWFGIYAPKGTPDPILEKLNKAIQAGLGDTEVVRRYGELGTTVFPPNQRSRQAHRDKFASEFKKLAELTAAAGLKPE